MQAVRKKFCSNSLHHAKPASLCFTNPGIVFSRHARTVMLLVSTMRVSEYTHLHSRRFSAVTARSRGGSIVPTAPGHACQIEDQT